MTNEEKDILRNNIRATIGELEDTVCKLTEASRPVAPDNAIGRLTRMEAINAKAVSEASLANARGRLSKLKGALSRLDSGDGAFGICRECEESIPEGRIRLMPESVLCVQCAGGAAR